MIATSYFNFDYESEKLGKLFIEVTQEIDNGDDFSYDIRAWLGETDLDLDKLPDDEYKQLEAIVEHKCGERCYDAYWEAMRGNADSIER